MRSFWNTDFAVPSDASYSRFRVTITPTLGTNYDLAVNLKYSDDTVDGVYQEDGVMLPSNEPYVIEASARTGETPGPDRNGYVSVSQIPKSLATRWAQAKPEKATALRPWPGKVLSPTQYRPGTEVRLNGIPSKPQGLPVGIGP